MNHTGIFKKVSQHIQLKIMKLTGSSSESEYELVELSSDEEDELDDEESFMSC